MSLEPATQEPSQNAASRSDAVPPKRWSWAWAKELLAKLGLAYTEISRLQQLVDTERLRADAATERLTELERRLSKDSRTSSKPPASDPLFRKPAPAPTSREAAPKRRQGGQPGHPGSTLRQRKPDVTVELPLPPQCGCGLALNPVLVGTRQVFDIPPPQMVVTEYHVFEACCACGQVHHSQTPVGVNAPAQYGPNLSALSVLLTQHHAVPYARSAQVLTALAGGSITPATAVSMARDAAHKLTPVVQGIKQAVSAAPVVNADETGMRVGTALMWLHAAVTQELTWLAPHEKRGLAAMKALGVLDELTGTLVHDGLGSYREFDVVHALCNAHHLRELLHVFEAYEQEWAKAMMDLLLDACAEVKAADGQHLSLERQATLRARYDQIVAQGQMTNPANVPSGRRGRTKQSVPFNLLRRLHDYADAVLRFIEDPAVPFTNNLAERAMRMPKVKLKVSGCFREKTGLQTYCTLRSYLATMAKQKVNLFEALVSVFKGRPREPCLEF